LVTAVADSVTALVTTAVADSETVDVAAVDVEVVDVEGLHLGQKLSAQIDLKLIVI